MKIDLSTVTFSNDIFTVDVEDINSTLILYRLNEDFKSSEAEKSTKVNQILVVLVDNEGLQHRATSIIGLSARGVTISTDVEALKGNVLNSENMQYCTIITGE